MASESFTSILRKYSAVDTRLGTDKDTSHSYGDIYDRLFKEYKNTKAILEIGFDAGGSLLAYADYFQNATIYGIDIHDTRLQPVLTHPRIRTYIGDATKKETIEHFKETYDIIIEDASHLVEHQIQHFHDYSSFVRPGGLYIIEDVNEMNQDKLKEALFEYSKSQGFDPHIIDLREIKNRFDDILFVFKRR